jgi:Fe-Mn family superoxide dismutase
MNYCIALIAFKYKIMENNRRNFLRISALLGLGSFASSGIAKNFMEDALSAPVQAVPGVYELPKLDYAYDGLEPFIDAKTMEIHYSKHHQTYVNKLNEALEKEPSLKKMQLDPMLKSIKSLPESVRTAIRNHGGGHWNHSFFWKNLKKGTNPSARMMGVIQNSYGSLDNFKAEFEKAGTGLFGSGWVWVINNFGTISITTTPNQDNPLMDIAEKQGKPVIALDVWEHAYYLKHQNKRADYVKNFWSVLNWEQAEKNMFGG